MLSLWYVEMTNVRRDHVIITVNSSYFGRKKSRTEPETQLKLGLMGILWLM